MILPLIAIGLTTVMAKTEAAAHESHTSDVGARPNIVFLCTDDQVRWTLGAYGNREIETPHLDSLARRGAIFRETTGLEGMRLATSQIVHDRFIEELPRIPASSQVGLLSKNLTPLFLSARGDFGGKVSWVGA